MENQPTIDYKKLFTELITRLGELTRQRDAIEVEIAKLKPLIFSTFKLLPEEFQKIYWKEIAEMEDESAGLQEAIKLVFSMNKGIWLTPFAVRDSLIAMGFEFKEYRANPLASIATTLKRMVPGHLQSRVGVNGPSYLRRLTFLDEAAKKFRAIEPPPGYQDEEEEQREKGR